MSQSTDSKGQGQPVRYKRKLRNYLIDGRFQLKYTTMIMVLSFVLIAALGGLLYQQVHATVEENSEATEALRAAATASNDAAKVSQENSEIIIAQALSDDYFKDPQVTNKFVDDMKKPVREVKAKAETMNKQAARAEKESIEYQRRARQLPILLVVFGVTFLVFLFLISIFTTHKIAGPMYKIKKLMNEVEGDSLHIDGALRKGDEMWVLFNAFNSMVERLRKHQNLEVKRVGQIIEELEKAKDAEARDKAVGQLRSVKRDMEAALE